jgi:diadenosine tetraphosphate (Ap4A) HIT family hydrolase
MVERLLDVKKVEGSIPPASTKMEDCLICERIALIKEGKNKYFVKELVSGYVVLGDHQYYKGYTLLLSKFHTDELHKLKNQDRTQFLEDMALVSEAVYKTFKPRKLNYELLGNTDSHLHWHIFPRYKNDPKSDLATWVTPEALRCSKNTIPTNQELEKMKKDLLLEINKLL